MIFSPSHDGKLTAVAPGSERTFRKFVVPYQHPNTEGGAPSEIGKTEGSVEFDLCEKLLSGDLKDVAVVQKDDCQKHIFILGQDLNPTVKLSRLTVHEPPARLFQIGGHGQIARFQVLNVHENRIANNIANIILPGRGYSELSRDSPKHGTQS
jgi:hypothetical protein